MQPARLVSTQVVNLAGCMTSLSLSLFGIIICIVHFRSSYPKRKKGLVKAELGSCSTRLYLSAEYVLTNCHALWFTICTLHHRACMHVSVVRFDMVFVAICLGFTLSKHCSTAA